MDALESVLSNSSKLMIDIKSGNNLMLLPLDKIINTEKLNETVEDQEEIWNQWKTIQIEGRVDNNEY